MLSHRYFLSCGQSSPCPGIDATDSRQRFSTHLFHCRRRSAVYAYTVFRLVVLECTRRLNNPLYHCRHNDI